MGTTLVWLLSSTVALGFGITFWVAMNALLNGLGSFVATSLIGDIFELMSIYSPFSLVQLLGMLTVVFTSITTFWCARKIFNFMMKLLGTAKA